MSKKTKGAKKGFWERAKESAAQQKVLAEREKTAKQKKAAPTSESKPTKPVEKTPEERTKLYKAGIIKTVVPAIIGTLAGFISFSSMGDATEYPWLSIMLFVIIFSYYAQRIVYPIIGFDMKEFGNKDWFYVEFITIDFWLVVWTLLLNQPL
ncbi:MAG: hypothetical protein P1P80_03315 [ANME-2 cluster archaeon]|nr:hypothetical protein [ANME-2 cluster archaeon]